MLSDDFTNLLSPSIFRNAADTIQALSTMEAPTHGGASILFIPADSPDDVDTDELGNSFCPCDGDDWEMWRRNAITELMQDVNGSIGEHFRYMITSAYVELLS
jgi:hypothetical protein